MLIIFIFSLLLHKSQAPKVELLDKEEVIVTNIIPEGIKTPEGFAHGFIGAICISSIFGIVALIIGLVSTCFCVKPLVLTHKRIEEFDQDDFDEMSE